MSPHPALLQPDWRLLNWFSWSAVASFVVVCLAYLMARGRPRWGSLLRALVKPLPHEAPNWSFSDSWASNAGVAAAIFAGFFGSTSVVTDVVGATNRVNAVGAIITVAAAVATAFLIGAPLILAVTTVEGRDSVIGFLLAATATLAGTGGEIAVIVMSAKTLNLGGFQHYLPWAGLAAAALLVVYALRSIPAVLAGPPRRERGGHSPRVAGSHWRLSELRVDEARPVDRGPVDTPKFELATGSPRRARSHVL